MNGRRIEELKKKRTKREEKSGGKKTNRER